MAYEGMQVDDCLRWCREVEAWILVAPSKGLSAEHLKELRRRAVQWKMMGHSDRMCYGEKWWQSGERKPVKLKQSIQIWLVSVYWHSDLVSSSDRQNMLAHTCT